jgi:hypothetical protein
VNLISNCIMSFLEERKKSFFGSRKIINCFIFFLKHFETLIEGHLSFLIVIQDSFEFF